MNNLSHIGRFHPLSTKLPDPQIVSILGCQTLCCCISWKKFIKFWKANVINCWVNICLKESAHYWELLQSCDSQVKTVKKGLTTVNRESLPSVKQVTGFKDGLQSLKSCSWLDYIVEWQFNALLQEFSTRNHNFSDFISHGGHQMLSNLQNASIHYTHVHTNSISLDQEVPEDTRRQNNPYPSFPTEFRLCGEPLSTYQMRFRTDIVTECVWQQIIVWYTKNQSGKYMWNPI